MYAAISSMSPKIAFVMTVDDDKPHCVPWGRSGDEGSCVGMKEIKYPRLYFTFPIDDKKKAAKKLVYSENKPA